VSNLAERIWSRQPQRQRIGLRRALRHWWLFVRIGWRSRAIYRADILLWGLGIVVINLVDLALLGVLLRTFTTLGGWSIWEIVYLYCAFLAALGLQQLFTWRFIFIQEYVQEGTLDPLLLRPSPPLLQIAGSELAYKDLAHIGLGLAGIAVAAARIGLPWTPTRLAWLVVLLTSGAVVLGGITLALCSLAFWTVRSRVFLFGTEELQEIFQHFPAHIFGKWFLRLTSTVLPFAFVNYYPTLILLGRAGQPPSLLAYASPLMALLVAAIALGIWRLGLRRYQSTGS
jgi:viologen exporter family transport system permease protein